MHEKISKTSIIKHNKILLLIKVLHLTSYHWDVQFEAKFIIAKTPTYFAMYRFYSVEQVSVRPCDGGLTCSSVLLKIWIFPNI